MTKLSPSRLNDFLGCPHQSALWLDGEEPPEHADKSLELLRAKGFEHEGKVLVALEQIHGPATRIDAKMTVEERVSATAAAIAEGAPLIYQAALASGRWFGFPDFLVTAPSQENGGIPEPEDAKLARKAKAEHLFQLGIYAELLEHVARVPVGSGVLHVAGGPPQHFDLRQTRYILRRLMRKFEAFAAQNSRSTRAFPCAACAQCDYQPRCEAEWRAKDSLFFVAGLSPAQVLKLEQAGLKTIAHLASITPGSRIDGIGVETLAKLSAQARLQLRARDSGAHSHELLPVIRGRGFTQLPPPDDGDLFFDMEGDPLFDEGLEYLFGLYGPLGSDARPKFQPLWAHYHEEEKVAFELLMRTFVSHLARFPNAHIYHYASYETTALKRLAMRYATMEAELDQMLRDRRFVDLYRVTIQAVRTSTESYSLKDIEKLYWGERSGEVQTAEASIVEYEKWRVTGDQTILDGIALYNQDDCVSTARLRAWLESLRPAGVQYEIIDETRPEKHDRSAERAQLEARKQSVATKVRASQQYNPEVRDLIAELLWFHQRAQKPGWWALYDRQSWSDDELIEDAESLGGLVRDPDCTPRQDKQSLLTQYKFLPQDTKLKAGDKPRIAETLGYAGTIAELDAEEGIAVLRKGVRAGALPERLSLIPAPISMLDVPDAVLRFAERFASANVAEDTAILDILLRSAPRLRGRNPGEDILPETEKLTSGITRAVMALDRSYLFVQGPPGTGKTYTIGEVICALIRAGYRVGVSSNSHKAIKKALEWVEYHAAKQDFRFSGVKKGNEDDPETEFHGRNITTVFSSEDVAPAHSLVGGTVFHFARPDQHKAFDFLIVDEAGQVALGNLVAMSGAAKNIVLVGDQMQLPQPVQGVHPGETGLSCLEFLLEGRATVPKDRGVLLNESHRLHPNLCRFVSEAIYDNRLKSHPSAAMRELVLSSEALPLLKPAGLSFVPVVHQGCTQASAVEADEIARLVSNFITQSVRRIDGNVTPLTLDDIVIVAPYNLQVNLLKQRFPTGTKIGTVDKFQGQEAPVVIVSMTTSKGGDAPRGTQFLFNPNRLNVAISRAQCLAIVVHGTHLLEGTWTRIDDLRRLNLFAHAEAFAGNAT